jgi:uncharacterized protein
MRTDGRESENVEDRRGQSFGGIPGGGRGLGVGAVLVALVASYFLGVDPSVVLGVLEGVTPQQQAAPVSTAPTQPKDQMGRFVSVVLADTEDTWTALFKQAGRTYRAPHLVLFSGATQTGCGVGETASGPFYCPVDQKVYIDLDFYRLLQQRFKAPGEFAQAYVVAHEIGHHVQNQLGIMGRIDQARERASKVQANALSVRLELQADCYAGIWAHHANRSRQILETGDVESALRAATAIGDDTLQRQTQGRVVPESFTHGSAEQRVRWFRTGLETGEMNACNTFETRQL